MAPKLPAEQHFNCPEQDGLHALDLANNEIEWSTTVDDISALYGHEDVARDKSHTDRLRGSSGPDQHEELTDLCLCELGKIAAAQTSMRELFSSQQLVALIPECDCADRRDSARSTLV